jgi:bifunctional non-homologous end joining protein LigD
MASSLLKTYRRKRNFRKTAEPRGSRGTKRARRTARTPVRKASAGFVGEYVIQKHDASRLHYDLRLELDGVMKSWAVPKGPSTDPNVKRLAVQVEDHPMEYNKFEGTIPKGQYGGGTVMIWDRGTYTAEGGDPTAIRAALRKGKLAFTISGERLNGTWALVQMKGAGKSGKEWLLIKERIDQSPTPEEPTEAELSSVTTGRSMTQISVGGGISPMLASVGAQMPTGEGWAFEPKYDGVRVLAFVDDGSVSLLSRNGNDKAKQFPEVTEELRKHFARRKRPFVIDGELVARRGRSLARFQDLQDRIHQKDSRGIAANSEKRPATLVAFDVLMDGDDLLAPEPWTTRRARLERLIGKTTGPALRLGTATTGSGARMLADAKRHGWEGIMAKKTSSAYTPGVRSRDWLKLKIEARQEFVVGGWTEPRNSRTHIGALLIGYWENGELHYAGHVGGGFTISGLAEMYRKLKPLERRTSPFNEEPDTNEKPHFVKPEVVVEVRFNEWTADGLLRQPIYLGTRDDKDAKEIRRERESIQARRTVTGSRAKRPAARKKTPDAAPQTRGASIPTSNLDKVYFPATGATKGDVMRFYESVAKVLLPAVVDRPLVLKRYPDGEGGKSFFQQNAPADTPDGVRVEEVPSDGSTARRLVGNGIDTIIYCVQLGAIDVNPWHSRVGRLEYPDYTILDLDPGPKAPFETVVQVARWVKEALDDSGMKAALKTSGSSGLHIYVPLPARTSEESSRLIAQLIATRVAEAHPAEATVERSVAKRPPKAVYVDYLQNVVGKSVASVLSVRPRPQATVSTPLDWSELKAGLDPGDFTMETPASEFLERGRLWLAAMRSRNTVGRLTRRAPRATKPRRAGTRR